MWTYLADSTGLTCSQESAVLLKPWSLGCDQWPIVRSIDTLKQCYSRGKIVANCQLRQSGMTCEHYQASLFPTQSTSSPADSHARILALLALERAWKESEAVYSGRSLGSLASYDPLSSSWKTCQQSLLAADAQWLEPLPKWGMTVDGVLSALRPLELTTSETAGSYWLTPRASDTGRGENQETFLKRMNDRTDRCAQSLAAQVRMPHTWPTPRASDGPRGTTTATESTKRRVQNHQANLPEAVVEAARFPTLTARDYRAPNSPESQARRNMNSSRGQQLPNQIGGQLNPTWTEWLMGYPSGWTELNALVTVWFRSKSGRHSKSLVDNKK